MTRQEFSKLVPDLLNALRSAGVDYVIGDVFRSAEEQFRLYNLGLSQCDGYDKISSHQKGKAIDIYIIVDGELSQDPADFKPFHELWVSMGGQEAITWDQYHFAVD